MFFRDLIDDEMKKKAIKIFIVSIIFLWLFGYNITLLGINYNGVVWDWRGELFDGTNIDQASALYYSRPYFLKSYGNTGYDRLYHIAVFLHVIYGLLLLKPVKVAAETWLELQRREKITPLEFQIASWYLLIIVLFFLNLLLVLHESNASFLTDMTSFAAPYRPNAQLHYEAIFYLNGRGWLFVALTALYPAVIYLNRKMHAKILVSDGK